MTGAPITIHDLELASFEVESVAQTLRALGTSAHAQGLELSLDMLARNAERALGTITQFIEQRCAAARLAMVEAG